MVAKGRCDELTNSTLLNFVLSESETVSAEMRRFWELESLKIRGDEIDTEYRDVVDGYLEEGIVERCMTEGLADEFSFYLPHHAVVREGQLSS
ncbi:DUF1758 domain-containing protein [Nephila pilipes]|uniref:DUF1758 domain-containing protein n=1 Tax=Nephila pilipes TaxID=299642 RepID=A0A8X6PDD0_NEPPI|nr:DUF1758 domain-containing protein [Nephila pilipes]